MNRFLAPAVFFVAALSAVGSPLSAAGSPGPGPEMPSRTLTPAEAVARALEHYPEVAAARADQRQAESARAEAHGALLPRLDLQGSAVRFEKPMPVTPFHGFSAGSFPDFDDTLLQADLHGEYTLYDGGASRGAVARQGARAEAAAAGAESVAQRIAERTVRTYLQVLAVDATLRAADRRIEAVDAERARVARLLDVGRAPEVDLRRAEAALASARADRVRLDASLGTATRELARLIGAGPGEVRADDLAPVSLAHPEPPAEQALAAAVDASPAVVRAARKLEAAAAAVQVARGGRRPKVDLAGDWKDYASSRGQAESEWNAGVQVALPLFHGGALAERVAEAEAARDAAAERLSLARLEARRGIDQALASLAESRARSGALGEAERQYAEVSRVEKLRLETGVGVEADYLDAEASLLGARASRVEAENGVVAARVELARLTGELSAGWIEDNLELGTREAAP